MIRQFTAEEMLSLWKRENGIAPSPSLLAIEDGADIEDLLMEEIDAWYERQLRNAPVQYLPVEDIAGECTSSWVTSNEGRIVPPGRMVRPLRLKMANWHYDVHTFPAITWRIENRERYVATASTPRLPNAALLPDGVFAVYGLMMTVPPVSLYFPPSRRDGQAPPQISEFTCVVRPPAGTYIFDTLLLPLSANP